MKYSRSSIILGTPITVALLMYLYQVPYTMLFLALYFGVTGTLGDAYSTARAKKLFDKYRNILTIKEVNSLLADSFEDGNGWGEFKKRLIMHTIAGFIAMAVMAVCAIYIHYYAAVMMIAFGAGMKVTACIFNTFQMDEVQDLVMKAKLKQNACFLAKFEAERRKIETERK